MLAAGGLLWGMSLIRWYPVSTVAACFSSDGILSDSYAGLLHSSQHQLGTAFLISGLLFGWLDAQRMLRVFCGLPFWVVAAVAGVIALLSGYAVQEWIFEGIPHVTDATSHLFQTKIFALGKMFVSAPDCADAFWQPNVMMTHAGRWFTKYTPGHALLLWGGLSLGLLRWVLPFCGLTIVVVAGKLLERYDGRTCARICMLLLATSPLLLLLTGSYMSHISAMAATLLGLFSWLHSRDVSSTWLSRLWIGLGGFFLAAAAFIRPPELVLIAGMGLLFAFTFSKEDWKWILQSLPWLVVGALPIFGFWAFWNLTIYDNPFAIGYGFTTKDVMHPSYQGHWGLSSSFGVREAFSLLAWNLDRANSSFWGWPASLLFIPFAFIRRGGRLLYLSSVGVAVVVGFYFFYNYQTELEARYYFLALPFFAYLTFRGMRNLVHLRKTPGWEAFARQGLFLLVVTFYLYSALYYWPRYLIPQYRDSFEDCSTLLERTVREKGLSNALILIAPFNSFVYSSGFIYNDPLLERDVLYARYSEETQACLRRAFPGRTVYRYDVTEGSSGVLHRLAAETGRSSSAVSGADAGAEK